MKSECYRNICYHNHSSINDITIWKVQQYIKLLQIVLSQFLFRLSENTDTTFIYIQDVWVWNISPLSSSLTSKTLNPLLFYRYPPLHNNNSENDNSVFYANIISHFFIMDISILKLRKWNLKAQFMEVIVSFISVSS